MVDDEILSVLKRCALLLGILKKHAKKVALIPSQENEPDIVITVLPEADEEYLVVLDWLGGVE